MRPGISAVVAAASYSTKRGRLKDRAIRHVPAFEQGWCGYKGKDTGSPIKDVGDDRKRQRQKAKALDPLLAWILYLPGSFI